MVAACLAGESADEVAGVPVVGDLDDTASVVRNLNAGTVAVLSCPEMDGVKLRTLAWELEKTGTDLCVAPALLDVAGPRTTVRPTAGLTLLHVDHPQLSGPRQVVKDLFDRCAAAFGLAVLSPLLLAIALIDQALRRRSGAVHPDAGGQGRGDVQDLQVPHDGGRTPRRVLAEIREKNESDGVLFKIRRDPRITAHRRAAAEVVA